MKTRFLVEKTIDLFLGLLGPGPVVLIEAAVSLIQGLLIGLRITDHRGLLNRLGGDKASGFVPANRRSAAMGRAGWRRPGRQRMTLTLKA